METTIQNLIDPLRAASAHLAGPDGAELLAELHDTEKLPDPKLSRLVSEALDLLAEVRLLLEPRQLILADHFMGYMNTKALCAAVELNIPDILRSSPKTLPELAIACGARADRLGQVMRTLRNNGIFSFDAETETYRNNTTSALLLSDHWTQWRNWVDLYGNEFYDMARGIPASCKRDAVRSPAQINFDTDDSMFKYFTDRGWVPKFHKTLSGGATAQAPGILADYPWEELAGTTVMDIGGGGGGLIALLLRGNKGLNGAILEAPQVIEQAHANFHGPEGQYSDVATQIPAENLVAGDFFDRVPESDVYVMKWCLHDWDDDKARVILKNIRASLKESAVSRLVILESVLRDGHMGRMSRYADLNMMVAVGGKERGEDEWRRLAEQTGWSLRKIYPLRNAWPSAIEFVPTWPALVPQLGLEKVVAQMRFLEPWDGAKGNPYIRVTPAPGFDRQNFNWEDHPVIIQDSRPNKGEFSLDTHGFAYIDDEIPDVLVGALRGDDKGVVRALYYPHIEEFVKRITGAPRVVIFDHTLRKRRPALDKMRNDDKKEQPAMMVHVDQSEKGALRRVENNLSEGEDLDDLLQKHRVQLINIWRPLNGPVLDTPLACMDYRTIGPSAMHQCDLLAGKDEVRGHTATFTHSDKQKWYYLNRHRTDEVTLIKIWDNKTDGVSRCCAHTAFTHPDTPLDVEPRESVEVRCIVIYDS
ncbi:S-adenosyl-L-methionine-dependent methyltransferase [Annulohypoxylon maeteangense]|uniref:S-adenosyl-L-methionine-dependent methyltransferase n=1 Tax=Annulohypoxylon maeteangense TaxID=1927788 RepID=UPI002008BDDD|nr:S-adenosyl-L-methionine-dependent methyltransferase [Annulohypoxylon maeteangense]KAI0886474.1 S-adenosyl-L-methionine-dependent methyltransferase [Annulohypoxylon maeteangense]